MSSLLPHFLRGNSAGVEDRCFGSGKTEISVSGSPQRSQIAHKFPSGPSVARKSQEQGGSSHPHVGQREGERTAVNFATAVRVACLDGCLLGLPQAQASSES